MDIRVKKMLGFGLTNVKENDARLNWDSPLFTYEEPGSYYDWLKNSGHAYPGSERSLLEGLNLTKVEGIDCAVYDSEYGLPNVLCIRPSWLKDWYRSDDSIDWVEETYCKPPRNENGTSWVKKLKDAPHPFNGSWMHARTGDRLGWEAMEWVRWDTMGYTEGAEEAAKKIGMTVAEAKRLIVPNVPSEIKNMARYLDLFVDVGDWKQLRPILYTWWS